MTSLSPRGSFPHWQYFGFSRGSFTFLTTFCSPRGSFTSLTTFRLLQRELSSLTTFCPPPLPRPRSVTKVVRQRCLKLRKVFQVFCFAKTFELRKAPFIKYDAYPWASELWLWELGDLRPHSGKWNVTLFFYLYKGVYSEFCVLTFARRACLRIT